jgi:hypothetical protein
VYQWYTNDVAIDGATGTNYTTPATSTNDSGKQFKVMVTNAYGAVTSSVATLTVNAAPAGGVVATGGTITNYTLNGTNYTAHIFTTNGTFAVSTGGEVEYLIVAGGGAGGKASTSSGGGGAGGLIYSNLSVIASNYTIIVGSGAVGRTTSGTGDSGSNSSFGAVIATGGGGGGGSSSAGGNGGSGGGAQITYGTGIAGQGKDGGSGTGSYIGGGGGAGSKGTNGVTGAAGHGGLGLAYDLSGELLFYAGGGGGCYSSGTSGNGGSGVGGNGGATPGNGMNGRGGGGGGGGTTTSGNGGSGIVIVRYMSGGGASTNTYTVSYSTNGATSGTVPASQTKTQGVTLVLATNVGNLARIGYTFSGWNTDSNGTGTTYAEGANYTANTGAVMYAYWITNAPPTITTHPTNITVLVGQTATFNVIATGTPTLVYQWYTNDVAISGAVGTNYTTPVATLSDSGKVYKVVVTNIFGTATSSNAILSVLATNNVPDKPIIVSPTNQATGVSASPSLTVEVSDLDGSTNLSVVFYGREYSGEPPTDFTIVHIPDSQMYYMQDNMAHIGQSIADWVVSNRASSNIVAAYQVGDVVQDATDAEFVRSTNTYYRLSDPNLTGLPNGLPWTIIGAAHDTLITTRGIFPTWNKYYGTNYFADKPYWGGCYNGSNEHNYILFSAGGLDFIILGLSQYADENSGALTWATNVLKTYSNRCALVVTHSLVYSTTRPTPSTYSAGGPGIWKAVKTCSNVFMVAGGHNTGHGWLDETNSFGQIVPLLSADYQGLADGGSGYFRLMRFHPSTGVVDFWTYSAYKTNVMTDDILVDSKFSITNSMLQVSGTGTGTGTGTTNTFVCLGTNTAVSSGQQTSKVWSGLSAGSTYQWYAVVSDGTYTNVSDTVTFTVSSQTARTFQFFRINTAIKVGSSAIHVQGEIK